VGAGFILEPIRWNRRFGWRCMTESEKLAWFWFWFWFWRQVGERLPIIPGIPHRIPGTTAIW
jgi:hypothetical protein